jgi:ABC-type multidrug transport system permease subunit
MLERSAFFQLLLARLREWAREPEVLFWVFGFPILLAIGLGIAFRNKPAEQILVGVVAGPGADAVVAGLPNEKGFQVRVASAEALAQSLRLGKTAITILPANPDVPAETREYRFDPTRPESVLARERVDDALQRAAGRQDAVEVSESLVSEPGARYIDFLIPGLLGMNIMSGSMWGVGFVLVDMRSRKLLKRLIATPMRKSQFLGAMMASRVLMVFVEMGLLLAFGCLAFGMILQGSIALVATLSVLGALVFSGLGILVASRAKKVETVSGLMNLVMLPMFVLSGVFFSSDRFPEAVQPFVKALPLTALNDALRAVVLEGADLPSQFGRIGVLLLWGAVSFFLALRMFRWT